MWSAWPAGLISYCKHGRLMFPVASRYRTLHMGLSGPETQSVHLSAAFCASQRTLQITNDKTDRMEMQTDGDD